MAQKVVVELVDDLDGTVAEDISTVSFGLNGAQYEIDLTEANAERLRDCLAGFVAAARRTGGRIRRAAPAAGPARPAAEREKTRAIREWAREHGYELADRGRIPSDVVAAYEDAQLAAAKPKSRRSRKKPTQPATD
jgi:hypothetical protein